MPHGHSLGRGVLPLLPFLLLAPSAWAGPPEGAPPTLVFVTKSDACDCEASLCVAGEQEVINFLAGNPWGFRRETVDLKATPEAAKELRILAVPVAFLRDAQGRRVARFDGFFAERDFYQVWEAHLAEERRR